MASVPLFIGLLVAGTNRPVPLTSVNYDVQVIAFASQVTINQTYSNRESNAIEAVYAFPINDQAAVTGFTVTIDNRTLVSRFKAKADAFQEYSDALAEGDGAYLLDQSDRSDDTFVLSVGRLPPNKTCIVAITYISTLESATETKMRLTIPMSLAPRYTPPSEASSSDTSASVLPIPDNYEDSVPYFATLNADIEAFEAIQSVTSPTHPISVKISSPEKVTVTFGAAQAPLDKDLVIEVEVKKNPQFHVEVEKISRGKFIAMYSLMPHFESNATVNTEIIFLVDCSDSMNSPGKIGEARRAMQILLKSLLEGSYFNFYRFGSKFESLFSQSTEYDEESLEEAKKYATETRANLGVTKLLEPLKSIFSKPVKPNFTRQLFLLTDGQVPNNNDVTALVNANAGNTRVFAFGFGDSPGHSLVNGVAAAGRGKAEYIRQGEVIEEKIAPLLKRALRPALIDAAIEWKGVDNVQQMPPQLPPVFSGDHLLVYAFFDLSDDSAKPSVHFTHNGRTMGETSFSVEGLSNDEESLFSKLAARALIKELELTPERQLGLSGSLQRRGQSSTSRPKPTNRSKIDSTIMELSLKYGIMSKNVSLVAVETRPKDGSAGKMELREVPIQRSKDARRRGSTSADKKSSNGQRSPDAPKSNGFPGKNVGGVGGSGMGKAVAAPVPTSAPKGQPAIAAASVEAPPLLPDPESNWDEDGGDNEGERPADLAQDSPNRKKTSRLLSQLLELQQLDGSWSDTQKVTQLTNVTLLEMVRGSLTVTIKPVITTVIAVAYIRENFADEAAIWKNRVEDAVQYLDNNSEKDKVKAWLAKATKLARKTDKKN